MAFILYRSHALVRPRTPDEARIWIDSRQRNKAADLTGFLHRVEDTFIQALEGPPVTINGLMIRLRRDRRHEALEIMHYDREDQIRLFPEWSMGFSDDPQEFDPLAVGAERAIRCLLDAARRQMA